jgi:hypothetical protein
VPSGFLAPGSLVTGQAVRIELAPLRPLRSPRPEHRSFHHWFSQ